MDIDKLIELVKLHGRSIYGFCYKLTGNKEDTDDLYQETFLKAMELRLRLDAARNPKAYLIAVAVQLHRNHRRKLAWRRKIAPTFELDEAAAGVGDLLARESAPENAVLSLELRAMIQRAAHRLSEKLKLPLYMHYTADMTIEEIASALSIPPGTVKSRLHKARMAIRKELEVEAP